MSTSTDEINDALVAYLGFGQSSFPQADSTRVVTQLGAAVAGRCEPTVQALLAELGQIEVDWAQHSLASAGQLARKEMQRRHPELSAQALDALSWKFTYDWQ